MIDLIKITTDKIKEMEDSGKIESLVKESVEKRVEEAIRDIFDWNFERDIKDAIKLQIGNVAEKIKLDSYNNLIAQTVQNILDNKISADLQTKIQEKIKDSLLTTRTELNLSEIVKEFKQIECDDEEEYSYTVTIKKEYDGSFETVYVSFCDESNGKTALELRLMKYEDNPYRLYCAYYDDFKLTDEINILKDFNKLEAMLIQAILNETTFVLDKNERWCENELCHYSD